MAHELILILAVWFVGTVVFCVGYACGYLRCLYSDKRDARIEAEKEKYGEHERWNSRIG